eukprot:scaffold94072_cov19-Prasinocladus_malaysianus.AAC.1
MQFETSTSYYDFSSEFSSKKCAELDTTHHTSRYALIYNTLQAAAGHLTGRASCGIWAKALVGLEGWFQTLPNVDMANSIAMSGMSEITSTKMPVLHLEHFTKHAFEWSNVPYPAIPHSIIDIL